MATAKSKTTLRHISDAEKKFKSLDAETQETLIEWSVWTADEWAADFITEITEGEYDKQLGDIARAANARLASVFKIDSPDRHDLPPHVAGAVISRMKGMELAAQIVKDLGLTEEYETTVKRRTKSGDVKSVRAVKERTLGVTRNNYLDIIEEHGEAHKSKNGAQEPTKKRGPRKITPKQEETPASEAVIDVEPVEEWRETTIMAKSIKPGDKFEGKKVTDIERVGSASVRIITGRTNKTVRLTTKVDIQRKKGE